MVLDVAAKGRWVFREGESEGQRVEIIVRP